MHYIDNLFLQTKKLKTLLLFFCFLILCTIAYHDSLGSKIFANFSPNQSNNSRHAKSPTPTPTRTPTPLPTIVPTLIPSPTKSISPTPTPINAPTASPSIQPTNIPTPTVSVTPIPRVDPVCVSSHIDQIPQSAVDEQTTLMQQEGVNWVRFNIVWGNIETSPGVYNWSNYDYVVNDVTSKGMNVIALITQWGVPSWESTNPSNFMATPKSATDFGNFVQAFATHYQGKISLYEIGNEPNIAEFWPPTPNANAYTQLLISGYNAVKAVNPSDKVISAGLAEDTTGGTSYLQQMYTDGAKNHFDYLGFHPYSWPDSPEVGSGQGFNAINSIMSVMTKNGDSKQIMVTEIGWPSTIASGGVDEPTQAAYINLFYQNILYGNYQNIPIACVYDFIDDGTDVTNPEDNFGTVTYTYQLKPSYSTLQQVRANYNANFSPINP